MNTASSRFRFVLCLLTRLRFVGAARLPDAARITNGGWVAVSVEGARHARAAAAAGSGEGSDAREHNDLNQLHLVFDYDLYL